MLFLVCFEVLVGVLVCFLEVRIWIILMVMLLILMLKIIVVNRILSCFGIVGLIDIGFVFVVGCRVVSFFWKC